MTKIIPLPSKTNIINYTISLVPQELILDIDDLEGIIQQLEAISQGLGMDFDVVEYEEQTQQVVEYEEQTQQCEWTHPSIVSSI